MTSRTYIYEIALDVFVDMADITMFVCFTLLFDMMYFFCTLSTYAAGIYKNVFIIPTFIQSNNMRFDTTLLTPDIISQF